MRRNVRYKKFDLCLGWGYMWNKHILVLLYEHFNLINALQCKTPIRCKNRINHLSLRIILVFLLFAKMFKKFKILCAKKRKIWEYRNSSFQSRISMADRLDLRFLDYRAYQELQFGVFRFSVALLVLEIVSTNWYKKNFSLFLVSREKCLRISRFSREIKMREICNL